MYWSEQNRYEEDFLILPVVGRAVEAYGVDGDLPVPVPANSTTTLYKY